MHSYVSFVFIFLNSHIFFADSSSKNDFYVAGNRTDYDEAGKFYPTTPLPVNGCPSNRCLRKCCKFDEIYKWKEKRCLPNHNDGLQAADWSKRFSTFEVKYDSRCPGKTLWMNDSDAAEKYQLFDNGSMYDFSLETLFSFDEYCMDYVTEVATIWPVICFDENRLEIEEENAEEKFAFLLYSTGLGISNLFLIITLVLYLSTPKLRKKVHDICFLFHVVTLIIGFSSLIGIQNMRIDNPACVFLGYMTQFWLLASFFWLNIMCIDMWRNVGLLETSKQSKTRKLMLYCLYAWGCPCLVLIFSLLADNYLPANHPLKTGFAEESCWFKRNKGHDSWLDPRYIYFYSFVSITLLINIYTFIDTAFLIKDLNSSWKENKLADSKRHKSQDIRFFLYLKLFLVMGLNWMMEVISYHSDGQTGIWIAIDFIDTLQGVFIFIIFIYNKRVLMILKKRFCPRKVYLKQQQRTFSGTYHNTSSKTTRVSVSENVPGTPISLVTINGQEKLNKSNLKPVT